MLYLITNLLVFSFVGYRIVVILSYCVQKTILFICKSLSSHL